MRRVLLLALLALVLAIPASAQKPPGARQDNRLQIQIVEAGLFRVTRMEEVQPGPGGVRNYTVKEEFEQATTTIPGRLGVHFGVRYRVIGRRPGATVPVTARLIYPAPGLRAPGAAEPERFSDVEMVVRVGDPGATYRGFGFDDEWEIVRGTWRFEFRIGDEVLATQDFTVDAR